MARPTRRSVLAATLAGMASAAHARGGALNPWPRPGVAVGHLDGMTLLRSEAASSAAVLGVQTPYVSAGDLARLVLMIDNRMDEPVLVSAATVSAADQARRVLPILSADALARGRALPDPVPLFTRVAAELAVVDADRYLATGGRLPTMIRPAVRDDGGAAAALVRLARDGARDEAEFAALTGLHPGWAPADGLYATGLAIRVGAGVRAFDVRANVGVDSHWFTFAIQR